MWKENDMLAFLVFILGLFYWVQRKLGLEPVAFDSLPD
jgi:hypothetical protein